MKQTIMTLIAAITILTGCGGTHRDDDTRMTVAVSIEPQRYFVEQIAGDKAEVKTLVPSGAKPETYDLTPAQIIDLSHCKAYFTMGHLPFERTWADNYSDTHPHTNIINLSHGIEPIMTDHTHDSPAVSNTGHVFVEPHTWMSVANALIIARNVRDGLCVADPGNKAYYDSRCDTLCQRLKRLDRHIRTMLADADSTFLIYHPALSYFARDYGLTQVSIEREGKEPSPREMKDIIDRATAIGIRVLFIQPEYDDRAARTLTGETGTAIVKVNPLAYDWEKEMTAIAAALSHDRHPAQ